MEARKGINKSSKATSILQDFHRTPNPSPPSKTMLFSSRPKTTVAYASLEDGDYDEESKVGSQSPPPYAVHTKSSSTSLRVLLGLFVTSCLAVVGVCTFFGHALWAPRVNFVTPSSMSVACVQPATRREWRTLSTPDKDAYIKAVQCLATRPSKLLENGTMYDDFPWVHKLTAPTGMEHEYYFFFPGRNLSID